MLLGAVVTAGAPGLVRIKSGDTLWDLARAHRTTVAAIQHANHLHGDRIYAGQLLKIPGTGAATPSRTAQTSSTKTSSTKTDIDWASYTVRTGDTVSALGRRFHTRQATLVSANHLRGDGLIRIGQHLRVPHPAAAKSTTESALITRHRAVLAARRQPSRAAIGSLVASTARRYGVDPSLAMAIALQESGFQQGVVSSADAIGVMQLLPDTATWLSDDVVARRLDIFSARDNITGGVVLLRLLLRATSLKNAIGAYYQGLGAIRRHGMYDDTVAYVRAVLANQKLFR